MMYVGGPVPRLDTGLRDAPVNKGPIDAEAQLQRLRTLLLKGEQSVTHSRAVAGSHPPCGEGTVRTRMARQWQKSSFSDGSDGDTCVELAAAPPTLHLRESDTPDTELTTTPNRWRTSYAA
jgi:hypothetical protein